MKRLAVLILLFASAALGQGPEKWCVELHHSDGTITRYAASPVTNVGKWAALGRANMAAVSGDRMYIGPGQFDGTAQLAFNSNLKAVIGAGKTATILHCTVLGAAFLPCSNCEYAGIDFEGSSDADIAALQPSNQPFGCLNNSDAAFTGIYVHDCIVGGAADGLFVKQDSACTGVFRNVDFQTNFDSVRLNIVTGGQTPAHAFDFYNCSFTQNGTDLNNKRGIVVSQGTVRTFGCAVKSDDSAEGGHAAIGYNASGTGARVEVYGGTVSTNGGTTNFDLQQASGGTIIVTPALSGSGTGGVPVTSGTITYNVASGVVSPAISAPSSPIDGTWWNDSTQHSFTDYLNGLAGNRQRCLFTQTSSVTVTNINTFATIAGTGKGTLTLPANYFVVGKTIRLTAYGVYSNAQADASSVQFRLKVGSTGASTIVLNAPAVIAEGDIANAGWKVEFVITCRTTGAGGTQQTQGQAMLEVSPLAGLISMKGADKTTTTALDTTASQTLDLQSDFGSGSTASETLTCTNLIVEELN